jgi:hypothetical protein
MFHGFDKGSDEGSKSVILGIEHTTVPSDRIDRIEEKLIRIQATLDVELACIRTLCVWIASFIVVFPIIYCTISSFRGE